VRRRAFLGALAAAPLGGARTRPEPAGVRVGLERVVAQGGGLLRGRRVGLLAHAASSTRDGRHAVDALREAGVHVVRLFAPEHGLRGSAAAGEAVASGVDAVSGLAVVSLYGARNRPSPEDLRGLEAVVVDLQDAGVRFFTYASTMLLCLEAAAVAGIEVVVLDRPNPLGGERVEGPERDPATPFSMVSAAPGPLVHGLTLGEMARFTNARRAAPGRLRVLAMEGWARRMTWTETGRPWTQPSPNLRSAEAAIAYPGTCLIEATNVSEGRGSEAPFLLIGAPWVRPELVVRGSTTRGFELEPAEFTPVASAAAPEPKLQGKRCRGVRVRVTDAAAAQPYALGLRLLVALRQHPEFAWVRQGAWLDTLNGTGDVRAALERGEPVEAILDAQAPAIARWRELRRSALLYA
jgi:uncharacterized protein YbbC (DUF1343 family)